MRHLAARAALELSATGTTYTLGFFGGPQRLPVP